MQRPIFEQIEGAAMGFPLSPIITNVYMEQLEKEAHSSAFLKSVVRQRYVNDTFVLWSHHQHTIELFLTHLNSQYESM